MAWKTVDPKEPKTDAVSSIWAKASKLLQGTFGQGDWQPLPSSSSEQEVRLLNGARCVHNELGLITSIVDADCRKWKFFYTGEKLVGVTDANGSSWVLSEAGWTNTSQMDASLTHGFVVNNVTADVVVEEDDGTRTYRPDGSTILEVTRTIAGEPVRFWFTEYPTQPYRAFVVVEERAGRKQVTFVRDANAKLHKFEYEHGMLLRYIDVSRKPDIVWHALYGARGKIVDWEGCSKVDPHLIQRMRPILTDVDLSGNRHYVSEDGKTFIVGPSGAAVSEKYASHNIAGGAEPVISLSSFSANLPDPF